MAVVAVAPVKPSTATFQWPPMFANLRKYAAAYAVAIGGVLLTCLSSWNVRQELQTSHLKEFEWAAGDRIQSLRAVVDQGLDALLEIRGLFHAAQGIDEQDFLDTVLPDPVGPVTKIIP